MRGEEKIQSEVVFPQSWVLTKIFVAVNCLIAGVSLVLALFDIFDPIREYFPFQLDQFLSGYVWQPFTYMWLHADLVMPGIGLSSIGVMHLAFNMFMLYMLGKVIERLLGSVHFFKIYIYGGLLSVGFYVIEILIRVYLLGQEIEITETQSVSYFAIPLVGASGSVFALFGVFAMLFPTTKMFILFIPIPIKAMTLTKGIIIISLIFILGGIMPNVAHGAHIGGLVAGILYFRHIQKRRMVFRSSFMTMR